MATRATALTRKRAIPPRIPPAPAEFAPADSRVAPVFGEAAYAAAPATALETLTRPLARRAYGLLPAGLALPAFALTAALALFSGLHGLWLQALLVLLIGGLISTHLTSVRAPGQLFGGVLLVAAFAIMLGVEYVYLADHMDNSDWFRMNTVFKFYEQAWVLVACGSAVALYALLGPRGQAARAVLRPTPAAPSVPAAPAPLGVSWIADAPEPTPDAASTVEQVAVVEPEPIGTPDELRAPYAPPPTAPVVQRPTWFSPARAVWLIPFGLLLIGSLIFTVAGTQSRVADRMPGDRPGFGTLNGMDWMDKTVYTIAFDNNAIQGPVVFHFERDALDWLNTHIAGTPVVAEAPLGYYRESGMMVGTYSGMPDGRRRAAPGRAALRLAGGRAPPRHGHLLPQRRRASRPC